MGVGRPSQEALRPLAFSTLADLVHHVRSKLDLEQLAKVHEPFGVIFSSKKLQPGVRIYALELSNVIIEGYAVQSMNLFKIEQVVVLFSRNLQDAALPLTVQTTSVRLLLNLVDYIFHNTHPDRRSRAASRTREREWSKKTMVFSKFGELWLSLESVS